MNARFHFISVLLIAILALTSLVSAQTKVGLHGGLDFEDTDFFVGANAVLPLGMQVGDKNLSVNPEGSYWITGDGYSLFIISLNLLFPLIHLFFVPLHSFHLLVLVFDLNVSQFCERICFVIETIP